MADRDVPLSLRDLALKPAYHKGEDDIAETFYVPCMARSIRYDRAVGYFSSSIYLLAWSSLRTFVSNGGRMRIICSPFMSEPDLAALSAGYEQRRRDEFSTNLVRSIDDLFEGNLTRKATQVLAALVDQGILDLRVAFVKPGQIGSMKRIFHDKLGLFTDAQGHALAFKGSMNETWNGLSNDGNIESIDVYVTWDNERERQRVHSERDYFDRLWSSTYPGLDVEPFPHVARERFKAISPGQDWQVIAKEIEDSLAGLPEQPPQWRPPTARPHQASAIANWIAAGRRGVLKHATGSGKTITALLAARDEIPRGKTVLVLVPSDLLLRQWKAEVAAHLQDLSPRTLLCGGGNYEWMEKDLLWPWSRAATSIDARVILATMQTASRVEFRRRLQTGDHLFVIADEVHRVGSGHFRQLMTLDSGSRLGLSATPERFGDAEGTRAIFNYFGEIVRPVFTLADGIAAGTLTRYFYHPTTVTLTGEEEGEWAEQTKAISLFMARFGDKLGDDWTYRQRLNLMLIQRARIAKEAANKIPLAAKLVAENFQPDQRWLVYCDNQFQMRRVSAALVELGIPSSEYFSAMTGDKERTLRNLEINGGVIVAIKCLDEGVDIPSVSHALILASSKNPREFIQRRGRVLRLADRKHFAHIFDAITVPRAVDLDFPAASIVAGELVRGIEFAKSAENPSASTELERIAARFNIDTNTLSTSGLEEDADE